MWSCILSDKKFKMLQSKLISLFRNFTKEELKRFEAFLLSPYFNQSEKMVKFFRLIEPHQPMFDSKKLEKEKLYKALYAESEYNDLTMRKLISDLFKLTKTFIAQEGFSKDNLQASVYRHRWLAEHNIEKMLDTELETRRILMDEYAVHDDDYYHHRWLYNLHKFKVGSDRLRGAEHKLFKDFDFWAPVHSHNRNYLINCFWLYLYLLTLEQIYNFSMDESLLSQVETLAPRYINQGDIVIDIFFNIFQLLRTDDQKYYFELKERFLRKDISVPDTLKREACVAMENYCIRKIREGEEQYTPEVMQIYRLEVENELYMENGKLDIVYYYNIALRGAESGELDWAEQFVESHKIYLPEDSREGSYTYAKAYILFARQKYTEALRMALSCNIPFFIGRITIRTLIVRIQYELGMMGEIQVELDSWKHQLKDEKISEERRQFFQNFFTTMRRLCDLKSNYSHEKYMEFSDHILLNKAIPSRKWFRDKIRELELIHGNARSA